MNPKYAKHEILQLGEVLQKVIKVSLSPYKDFRDLLERGTSDFFVVEELEEKVTEMHQRVELKKVMYGENADLGDADIMKSDSEGAVFARKLVKNLSEHIQFLEDEERKLDDI